MTTITIRIPDEGAIRLLEESIKAGVSPDRFVAMLIEERLKRGSAPASSPPKQSPKANETPQVPELNQQGLKALEKMFKNFGAPPGMPAPPRKRTSAKRKRK